MHFSCGKRVKSQFTEFISQEVIDKNSKDSLLSVTASRVFHHVSRLIKNQTSLRFLVFNLNTQNQFSLSSSRS
jgi:hypothetical protein